MKRFSLFLLNITSLFLWPALNFAAEKPPLALVIDDLGYSLTYGQQAFNLAGNHTYSIIPNAIYANKLLTIGQQQNKELMMHLPMQSTSHTARHESNTLSTVMDETVLIETTQNFLNKMPNISGINNHMGSHLTKFDYIMRPVMETIYQHNPQLYFLDSRTSANSTAYTVARQSGLTASRRNIFLDHSSHPDDIKQQFNIWLKRAREGRSAIAIAHPTQSTLTVLRPLLEAEKDNYQFMALSQYLAYKQELPKWPQKTHLSLLHKAAKTSKPSP